MIRVGCFDDFSLKARLECEHEFNQWNTLTTKQKEGVRALYDKSAHKNVNDVVCKYVKEKSPSSDKFRLISYSLVNPPMDLSDSKKNLIDHEKQLLGINITCSHIERASVPSTAFTCKKVNQIKFDSNNKYKEYEIVSEISEFQEFKIKNGKMVGQMMGNLKLNDATDELDVVVFPNELDQFQSALYEGNIVLVTGKKSNRGGLILSDIKEI